MAALQSSAGNRAVTNLVVQRAGKGAAPAPPGPATELPDATTAAAKPSEAETHRMVDNDKVVSVVYPYREGMLRRFVDWHRSLELAQLEGDDQTQALQQIVDGLQAELDRLQALPTKSKDDEKQITTLDAKLKKAKKSAEGKLQVAKEWAGSHAADNLSGPALEAEVKRLGTALKLPPWEITTIINYGGMRYGRDAKESGGGPTAHGSYFSPQRLLWAIASVRGGKELTGPDAQAFFEVSDADALARLQAMHDAGDVPAKAWRLIVYRTDLRTDTTDADWNKVGAKDLEAIPAGTTPEEKQKEADWSRVMNLWTADRTIKGTKGAEANVTGATGWRNELYRRGGVVALGVVCNELSESIAHERGLNLAGGITANVRNFSTDKGGGGQGTGTAAAGRYFGPVDDQHLVPGANLFWVKPTWQHSHAPHDEVIAVAGVTYPQLADPEVPKAPPPKAPAKGAAAATTTPSTPAPPPVKTEAPTGPLPTQAENGWTYQVEAGKPIGRTKVVEPVPTTEPAAAVDPSKTPAATGTTPATTSATPATASATPAAGGATPADAAKAPPPEQQWMTWMHEATVAEVHGEAVWTLETTGTPLAGGDGAGGAGLNSRKKSTLEGNLKAFLGVDAAAGGPPSATTTAPAATTTPATPPATVPPVIEGAVRAAGVVAGEVSAALVPLEDIERAAASGRGQ